MTAARIRTALLVIGLGTLIAPLDTALNVAFPAITEAFAIPVRDIQWVITMFGLAQVGLTISFGKIGDRYGHRRVFMAGLVVSAVALTLCASAWSYPSLVVMRVLQGVGAGLLMACGPALVTLVLPAAQRRRALAFYTILMGLGMCLGPLIAGALVHWAGWPAVFWFRVPIALVALAIIWRMPALEDNAELQAARAQARRQPLDKMGSVALTVMLAALVFVLVQLRTPYLGYASLAVGLLIGWMALRLLSRATRRAADPVIDLRHFARPRFRALQLVAVLIQATTFIIFLLMPYQLAAWPGLSLTAAGFVLAAFPAGTMLAGLLGGVLSDRLSAGHLVIGGCLLAVAGLLAGGWAGAQELLSLTVLALLSTGFGLGMFLVGHLDATVSSMPIGDRGVAGSIVSVTRIVGIAISANMLMWLHDGLRAGATAPADYGRTFLVVGGLLLLGTVFYWLRFGRQEQRAPASS